jgi:hypothetical protein
MCASLRTTIDRKLQRESLQQVMSERIINLTNKKAPYNQVGGLMINAYRNCPIQVRIITQTINNQ